MSRPKTVGAYPGWLVTLLADFESDRRERTLTFPTRKAANSFRLDLGGFKGAVRTEGAADLWPNVLAIRTQLNEDQRSGQPWQVRIYHADDTPAPEELSPATPRP